MRFLTVQWHDTLASTSTHLRECLRSDPSLPAGSIIAAREQTAGRGRQGRKWFSSPGRDLTFSFLLRPRTTPERLLSLPLAVALGVAEALAEFGVNPRLKWPNDIRVRRRKIGGILIEVSGEASLPTVIVGIGVNVNQEAAAAPGGVGATSIFQETGSQAPVDEVLRSILDRLSPWLARWEKDGFAALRERWLELVDGLGAAVVVSCGAREQRGILAGFGEWGELLLRQEDGSVRPLWDGAVELAD